jgi:hypothetical protein
MRVGLSLFARLEVAVFWLVATRGYHPSWSRACIVTASLITAYAAAAYINHLVLLPRFRHRRALYGMLLLLTVISLTAAALGVILLVFFLLFGLSFDLPTISHNYQIDLFGMVVHVVAAAVVVWLYRRLSSR